MLHRAYEADEVVDLECIRELHQPLGLNSVASQLLALNGVAHARAAYDQQSQPGPFTRRRQRHERDRAKECLKPFLRQGPADVQQHEAVRPEANRRFRLCAASRMKQGGVHSTGDDAHLSRYRAVVAHQHVSLAH
jgi:hypothetical protein